MNPSNTWQYLYLLLYLYFEKNTSSDSMIKSYALAENKFNKFAYFNRIYQSVAHFTMRTYGENQTFRFVEGIWLHRKIRQNHLI